MKFDKPKAVSGAGGGGPSSAIGLIRFFDTDAGGPKISPEFIFAITIFISLVLLGIHFFS